MDKDALFKENYATLCGLVRKRRGSWKATSVMEFEDLESVLLTRIYQQLHLYDVNRPLDKWANTVISNAIMNILRDRIYRDSRPCISGSAPGFSMGSSYGRGCACNMGGDSCSFTASKIQDSSCSFYAAWLKKKAAKFAVSTPLSIENHIDESHNIQSDFVDYEGAKKVIDEKIVNHLNKEEAKIYRLLYIEHLSQEEVGRRMGFKKQKNSSVAGYLQIRTCILKFKDLSRTIIEQEHLVGE